MYKKYLNVIHNKQKRNSLFDQFRGKNKEIFFTSIKMFA